jgi:hypothetical protein
MNFNEIIRSSVGVDLSALKGMFRYPIYFVKTHYCALERMI